jgi:NDP-sugar pyrophosphorylase family protein
MISKIDIVVLAGGLGTRLQGVLPGIPKAMAPVAGKPFLDHLLVWLREQGAGHVVLSLGYQSAVVLQYIRDHAFLPLQIVTVVEPKPLGTAGAIAFARPALTTDPVLVINGDTFVDVDLNSFLVAHRASGAAASLVCVRVDHPGRYGRLELDQQDRIIRFEEKDPAALEPSWINAGVYLFNRSVLDHHFASLHCGSLERDILAVMPPRFIHAFKTQGRFLDIGTPHSLDMASEVLQR